MTTYFVALIVGGVAFSADLARGDTGEPPIFSLSGFGTLGAVRSSEHEADFVNSINQPTGAGYTRSVDIGPDSKLGIQLNGNFGERLSGVVQVVSQHQFDNSYAPKVEWANLKYQMTPDWNIRGGRVALPVGMVSDYRLVGYSSPWVRPPLEAYSIIPVTSIDGVDSTWRSHFGGATNSLQGLVGEFHNKFPNGESLDASDAWGVGDTLEYHSWSLRASVASTRVKIRSSQTDLLFNGLMEFGQTLSAVPGLEGYGAQSLGMADRYAVDGGRIRSLAIGASYDEGPWLLMAEWIRLVGTGVLADNTGAYVTAAYRMGQFTPYVTLSRLRSTVPDEQGITTMGLPAPLAQNAAALNAGVQTILSGEQVSQSALSLGIRWDLRKNVDLKVQYDHMKLGAGSGGQLTNYQPGFTPGGSLNLLSLALDFVF